MRPLFSALVIAGLKREARLQPINPAIHLSWEGMDARIKSGRDDCGRCGRAVEFR
jgi:hypothetical protein